MIALNWYCLFSVTDLQFIACQTDPETHTRSYKTNIDYVLKMLWIKVCLTLISMR